ncbi:MAG: DUF29 domain-containing protein [Candidatus Acididesulfobacter diazotrophicus]|jgi:hypothetical protein|uniref:DUF29 domain-containing protein n=1 Tax=Candidatus Acididesulfobacter diazotrophicus TaxID=2597226 RepID=A0A519BLH2_9DELT|nr:MAG: DUF29 domain-containing protein [Candidatus Acididesulfobacter diazotrophicus]
MLNIKEKQATGTLNELYHTDYYTWAITNAELLKEGKLNDVDYINLAEEVKDLGNSEYYRLVSFFTNLLSHMYKWDNQPELRSKSWENTIKNSIRGITSALEKNPGLKYQSTFNNAYISAWKDARYIISDDIDMDIKFISKHCPYTFKEVIYKVCEIAPDRIDEDDIAFLKNLPLF